MEVRDIKIYKNQIFKTQSLNSFKSSKMFSIIKIFNLIKAEVTKAIRT
jgi:hypothetical protein